VQSARGASASIVLLFALPLGIASQLFFDAPSAVLHIAFAVGFALLASAIPDFAIPRWINRIVCVAAAALAAVFLLQGISEVLHSEALTQIAYGVLGQRLEAWLGNAFLLWCVALVFFASEGRARLLGVAVVSLAWCLRGYSYALSYLGVLPDAQPQGTKILYLLLFVWILVECCKSERGFRISSSGA
jgi:hypothetical protein